MFRHLLACFAFASSLLSVALPAAEIPPVAGQVLNAAGEPLARHLVSLRLPARDLRELRANKTPAVTTTTTDAEGRFALPAPRPACSYYLVQVDYPDGSCAFARFSPFDDVGPWTIRPAAQTGTLQVDVRDSSGTLLKQGRLYLRDAVTRIALREIDAAHMREGKYRFEHLAPGNYTVEFDPYSGDSAEQYGMGFQEGANKAVHVSANTTHGVQLTAPAPSWLDVQVLNAEGKPEPSYFLQIKVRSPNQTLREYSKSVEHAPEGWTRVCGISAGDAAAFVSYKQGNVIAERQLPNVEAGRAQPWVIQATHNPGKLQGKVTYATGTTTGTALSLSCSIKSTRFSLKGELYRSVDSEREGSFHVTDLYPGAYELGPRMDGKFAYNWEKVTIPSGDQPATVALKLTPLSQTEVGTQVVDEQGHPVAGASVRLRFTNHSGPYGECTTETDAQGRWRALVPSLALATLNNSPGVIEGRIFHPGYGTLELENAWAERFLAEPTVLRRRFPVRVRLLMTSGTQTAEELQHIVATTPYSLHLWQRMPPIALDETGSATVYDVPRGVSLSPRFLPPSYPLARVDQVAEWYMEGKRVDGKNFRLPLDSTPDVELRMPLGLAKDEQLPGDYRIKLRLVHGLTGEPMPNVQIGSGIRTTWSSAIPGTDAHGELELTLEPRNKDVYGITMVEPPLLVGFNYGQLIDDSPSSLKFSVSELEELTTKPGNMLQLKAMISQGGWMSLNIKDGMEHPLKSGFLVRDEHFSWGFPAVWDSITLHQFAPGWHAYQVVDAAGVRQRFTLRNRDAKLFRVVQKPEGSEFQVLWNGQEGGEVAQLILSDYLEMPEEKE